MFIKGMPIKDKSDTLTFVILFVLVAVLGSCKAVIECINWKDLMGQSDLIILGFVFYYIFPKLSLLHSYTTVEW